MPTFDIIKTELLLLVDDPVFLLIYTGFVVAVIGSILWVRR